MKQSRRAHEGSDLFDEDLPVHKHGKRTGHHHREKLPTGEMVSYHRSSANDRTSRKHSKQYRPAHDKHAIDDMPRNSSHGSRSRHSHQCTDDHGSDTSDEILIKGRASRRARRDGEKNITRQLKSIERAQRDALRPSSSSSQEIHIHYVPVVTKSASPPLTSSRQSRSRSSSTPRSTGITAKEITSQLKGITMSLLGRRSGDSHKHSRRSRSRGKYEKRDKHGKKRASTSKFLAPLAQRWVCYKCGKLRSDTIQERHPLREGQKMQPNWCGKCRVEGELFDRKLVFDGQRHYCWGCGIVRSRTYHKDNFIDEDEASMPNYCRPCREVSPAFDYNLREASEIGSVASVREKAFYRQMHDAELSDVDEDEDAHSTCALGKENENPKSKSKSKLKASKSFMLENLSYKVKNTSDESSEGSVPISILKALHMEQERARSSSAGGCRLSDGSYQSPTAESTLSEDSDSGRNTGGLASEALAAAQGDDDDYEMKSRSKTVRDEEPSSPTVILARNKRNSGDSSIKKRVHWSSKAAQPTTAVDSHLSDSAYCSSYPSDLSYKSTGSRRSRRDPGDISTGSPPVHEGESIAGDLRRDTRQHDKTSSRQPESQDTGFGKNRPTQSTFGEQAPNVDDDTRSYRRDSTRSSHRRSVSPTLPRSPLYTGTGFMNHTGQAGGYETTTAPWVGAPEIPSFSRHYHQSPDKQHASVFHSVPDAGFPSGFGARPAGYSMPEYGAYQSAAHFSESTQRRDRAGLYESHGPAAVHHGDWPSASCPMYGDDDYSRFLVDGHGGFFATDRDSHSDSVSDSDSDSDSDSLSPAATYFAFDFSGLGAGGACGGTANAFAGGDNGGFSRAGDKFVRSSKKKNEEKTDKTTANTQDAQDTQDTTPRQHSWRLYDDGDDDDDASGRPHHTERCEWRKDGRTTVHRSGGGAAGGVKVPREGKTVQILSIREMGSDEEELAFGEDIDEMSELDTVIGDEPSMKAVCAALSR